MAGYYTFPPSLAVKTWSAPRDPRGLDWRLLLDALEQTDFCLICGVSLTARSLRCPRHFGACLDPDCHLTVSRGSKCLPVRSHPLADTRDLQVAYMHNRTAKAIVSGIRVVRVSLLPAVRWLWTDSAGVELFCPCCTLGCPTDSSSWNISDIIDGDDRAERQVGRKYFVYRYRRSGRSETGPWTFGMTYFPDQRADQRSGADAAYVPLESTFVARITRGLDWLSSPFDGRFSVYFLECYMKWLSKLCQPRHRSQACSIYARLLAANGLFDLTFARSSATPLCVSSGSSRTPLVAYTLSFRPVHASMRHVYAALYEGPETRLRLRLSLSCLRIAIRPVPDGSPYLCFTLLVPVRLVFRGFHAEFLLDGSELARRVCSVIAPPCVLRPVDGRVRIGRDRDRLARVQWAALPLPAGLELQFSVSIVSSVGDPIRSRWFSDRLVSLSLPAGDRLLCVQLVVSVRVVGSSGTDVACLLEPSVYWSSGRLLVYDPAYTRSDGPLASASRAISSLAGGAATLRRSVPSPAHVSTPVGPETSGAVSRLVFRVDFT